MDQKSKTRMRAGAAILVFFVGASIANILTTWASPSIDWANVTGIAAAAMAVLAIFIGSFISSRRALQADLETFTELRTEETKLTGELKKATRTSPLCGGSPKAGSTIIIK